MESELVANLMSLGTAYAAAKKLELGTVGRLCAADGRFFSRLDDGKTFTVKKYDEVVGWFHDNWPENLEWPEKVRRPVLAEVDQ